jgi:RimJ/RimL family protein N-acetyltransferase
MEQIKSAEPRAARMPAVDLDIGGGWRVRSWRPGDEAALVKYANNRNIWINLRDAFPHPYTRSNARAWVQRSARQRPATQFAIASEQEAAGAIGFLLQEDVYRRSAEVGYWLGEPFWGRGITTRALRALTDYAFAQFDLVRLYATVFEWNPASVRVLEKSGFTFEGRLRKSVVKDGKTIDQFLYAMVQGE